MAFEAFQTAERDGWNSRADVYGNATALATLQIVPAMLDALRLHPGMALLDMACGPGHLSAAADALLVVTAGVDFAPAMIDLARKSHPALDFDVADIHNLPFGDAVFDAVSCNMGLFHVTEPSQVLAEAARVLRPGGRFAFSQWTAPSDSDLYARLFEVMTVEADMSLANPAPDAYALSDPANVEVMMTNSGFKDVSTRRLETVLIAPEEDFFDFFMKFGVRVPLIVGAQTPDVQQTIRVKMNAAMIPYKTKKGFEVPMPSLLFAGTRK